MQHLQSKRRWIIVSLMPPQTINNRDTVRRARWAALARLQSFRSGGAECRLTGEWEVAVIQEPAGGVTRWGTYVEEVHVEAWPVLWGDFGVTVDALILNCFYYYYLGTCLSSYWTQVSWGLVLFPCLGIQETLWSTVEKVVQAVSLEISGPGLCLLQVLSCCLSGWISS